MEKKLFSLSVVCGLLLNGVQAADRKPLDCMVKPEMYVELSSPVDGVLESVSVSNGDLITKGQVLAKLESSVETAKVNLARQETMNNHVIESKKIELDFTERNKKRYQEMYKKESIAYYEEDRAKTDASLAKLAVEKSLADKKAAELQLQLAQAQLEQKIIKSPINGIVVERLVVPGESVNGRSIMKLAQINPLRVECIVPAEMFGQITKGMSAEVSPEKPVNKTYKATVTSVDKLIDPASGTFTVRMSLPNPDDKIVGGVNCKVAFNSRERSLFSFKSDDEPVVETAKPAPALAKIEPKLASPAEPTLELIPKPVEPTSVAAPSKPISESLPIQESIGAKVTKTAADIKPAEPAQQAKPVVIETVSKDIPTPLNQAPGQTQVQNASKANPPTSSKLARTNSLNALPKEGNTLTPDEFAKIFKNLNQYSQVTIPNGDTAKIEPMSKTKPQVQELAPSQSPLADPAIPSVAMCYDLGPFRNPQILKKSTRAIAGKAVSFQVINKEEQVVIGYQVLYPVAQTPEQITANEVFLKSKGIRDYTVLLKGPNSGAISLGIAPNEQKAGSFVEELKQKGVYAEIQPRYKGQLRYYAHFSIPANEIPFLESQATSLKQWLTETNLLQLPSCLQ